METIRGRKSLELDTIRFKERLRNYHRVCLDLGTGDGRYARTLAERHPDWFLIGVDSCRENLHKHSRAKLQNLLFIVASAQQLPEDLNGAASHITINFPWGSLLESLLAGDEKLMRGLEMISTFGTSLDLRLNGGALAEAGSTLEAGTAQIYNNLVHAGWCVDKPLTMETCALRSFPSTWAKRLAFGRDPRAIVVRGQR